MWEKREKRCPFHVYQVKSAGGLKARQTSSVWLLLVYPEKFDRHLNTFDRQDMGRQEIDNNSFFLHKRNHSIASHGSSPHEDVRESEEEGGGSSSFFSQIIFFLFSQDISWRKWCVFVDGQFSLFLWSITNTWNMWETRHGEDLKLLLLLFHLLLILKRATFPGEIFITPLKWCFLFSLLHTLTLLLSHHPVLSRTKTSYCCELWRWEITRHARESKVRVFSTRLKFLLHFHSSLFAMMFTRSLSMPFPSLFQSRFLLFFPCNFPWSSDDEWTRERVRSTRGTQTFIW